MSKSKVAFILILLLASALSVQAGSGKPIAPTVTTTAVTGIGTTTASSGGDVTADGGQAVTARGVCWSTSADPTTADSKTTDGSGTGAFTSALTGLTPNTPYHVRAYATNVDGTAYGADVGFTTNAITVPTVVTTAAFSITAMSAVSGGNVTSDGGAGVSARGVCWSTSANPTTADSKTTEGIGTGVFTTFMTGLTPGTPYHIRAYATNGVGTGYGADLTFTTELHVLFDLIHVFSGGTTDGKNPTGSLVQSGSTLYGMTMAGGSGSVGTIFKVNVNGSGYELLHSFSGAPADGANTDSLVHGGLLLSGTTLYGTTALGGANDAGTIFKINTDGTGYALIHSFGGGANGAYPFGGVVLSGSTLYGTTEYGGSAGNQGIIYKIDVGGTGFTVLYTLLGTLTGGNPYGSMILDGSTLYGMTKSGGSSDRGAIFKIGTEGTDFGLLHSFAGGTTDGWAPYGELVMSGSTLYGMTAVGGENNTGTIFQIDKAGTGFALLHSFFGTVTDGATPTGNLVINGSTLYGMTSVGGANNAGAVFKIDKAGTGFSLLHSFSGFYDGRVPYGSLILSSSAAYGVAYRGGNADYGVVFSIAIPPTVTTAAITDITYTTAAGGGNVTSDGGSTVTARGVCWSTSANPTTADNKTTDGSGTGAFTSALTGLTSGTPYHVRAYATNDLGTAYGDDVSFTAAVTAAPTVSTTAVTGITSTAASSGGNVSSDGGSTVTVRGVCWSTSANPTTADSKTTDGTGTGTYTSALTGLTPNTPYHVRAYATNAIGTSYGSDVGFTSSAAAPTLTTTAVTAITSTTASSGGNVSSDGGAAVTARGVCWSTSANPTTANSKTTDGSGTGAFTSALTGLTPNTPYHVRAYATNSVGTSYGSDVGFTTTTAAPTLTTTAVTAITSTTASSGGNISSDGGAAVTARGVCWSLSANPTTADSKTTDGTGTGAFTSALTGLAPNTPYHVRAYATNTVGTSYGSDVGFTTTTAAPTLTTTAVTAITSTTASSGGNISSDGGAAVTARGVCWSLSANPTTADSKTTDGTGTGAFTSALTGLTPNTPYHVRAYATNAVGTSYGSDVGFTTTTAAPTLTTTAVTAITSTTASSGGNISSDGGAAVTARGVCWSTSANPTTADSKTTDGTGTGAFTSALTGLTPNTPYHVRAYATNSVGTSYGADVGFTTTTAAPTLTTTAVTAITSTTASSGGNISSDGGSAVTARGVCWSTSANPTTADSKTTDGTGTGAFTSALTGLTANTPYHVRAYATNAIGTSYGSDVGFTTSTVAPTLTTTAVTAITSTTASSGGNISSDGGSAVTVRGVCWSTSANPTTADSKTTDGTGTGAFTSALTGLTANTPYHVRAYATNSVGTSYGSDVGFTTSTSAPTLTTTAITGITATTAAGGGNVTSDGGSAVTARGVCWSTSADPTTADSKTTDGTGTGTFTSALTGLTPNTPYHVRAYATNSVGTSYGSDETFTTSTSAPMVTTAAVLSITSTTASSGGNVTSDAGSAVTARGVCWSTSANPTTANSKTTDGSGTGSYASSMTGLTPNTPYHVRAYATNALGTSYGSDVGFTTTTAAPTLTTTAVTGITSTAASGGGNVASDGGSAVTVRGVCWSKASNPTTANSKTTEGGGTGAFTSSITGLSPHTRYYVRAYATNAIGTGYGDEVSFVTAIVKDNILETRDVGGVYYRNADTGVWINLASPATLIAAGDLDADGIDDLIGIWPGQGGVWAKSSKTGGWSLLSSTASQISAGDMNGDGATEFLGTWDGQGVFYRTSSGGSWVQMATPASMIIAGDLDGDGTDDLIGVWPGQGGIYAKLSATGTWSYLGSTPRDMAVGDMNGDGRVDLVGTWDGQGVFYKNSITGQWVLMATPADQITAGDLDGDGTDDLIGSWAGQAGLWVKYAGAGTWSFIGTTARDIATGKLAGGLWPLASNTLGMMEALGGISAEAPSLAALSNRSIPGPGSEPFLYQSEPHLVPMELNPSPDRVPGPGEPGFHFTIQNNLWPEATKENTKPHDKIRKGSTRSKTP